MFRFESDVQTEPVRSARAGGSEFAAGGDDRRLDVSTLLRVLRQRADLIVLVGILSLGLAIGVMAVLKPVYTSGIQILLDPSDLRVLENEVTTRTPQADSGISLAESQARVIQSNAVLRRVVERLHLDRDPDFTKPDSVNPIVVSLKRMLGLVPPPSGRDPVNVAMDSLREVLGVRRAERTFVIDVSVKARDPERAAEIANAVGTAYLAEEAAARTEAAKRVSDVLTGRLAGLRQGVEEAEKRVVQYRRENKLISASGRLLTDQQLGDLNQELVTAAIRAAEARERVAQAEHMRAGDVGTALPEMLQSVEMQALRQQYATLTRTQAELASQLGARHPAMAEVGAKMRDTERRINAEKARIVEATRKNAARAIASEAAIRRQLTDVKSEMVKNESALVGLGELERERDARRTVYENVLRRSRETGEQERFNALNVRIISEAVPPRQRSWPPSPRIVLPAALILGLLAGAGLVLALHLARAPRYPSKPPVALRHPNLMQG